METFCSYLIYFITFFTAIFFSYLYAKGTQNYLHNGRERRSCFNFIAKCGVILGVFLPLICLYTFRYGVGVDYFSYIDDYKWYAPLKFSELSTGYLEIGYGAVNILAYRIFGNYRGLLFLNSLLTLVPAIVSIYIFDAKRLHIGLTIYLLTLFPSSFNGMRQHIAVSFVMLSIAMLYNEKYVKYICCVIIGCLFHKTAIIALVFFIIQIIGKRNRYLMFQSMVIAVFISILIMDPVLSLMSKLPIVSFYYNKYIDTRNVYSLTHYIVHTIFRLPLVVILLIYYKNILKKNEKNILIIIAPFFDFIFIFMSKIIRWAIRMTYFTMTTMPFSVMLIDSNERIKDRDKKVVLLIIISLFIIRFVVLFGYAGYDGIMPYKLSFMS